MRQENEWPNLEPDSPMKPRTVLLDILSSPASLSTSMQTVLPREYRKQWELDVILLVEFLSTFFFLGIFPERSEYLALT